MVKAEALTKCFGKTEILKNLTCEIRDGSIYGLIGANGAGKSTLLRLIAGIYYPDNGSLKIDGEEIFDNLIKKKDVVFVADEFYIPAGCTVEQYAAMYSVFYDNFDYSFFWKHLEMLGLPLKGKIMNFSKGMKRQLVMLCALSCKCKTILFDETFDGLDPVVRNLMKNIIYNEVVERGVTVIMTSHNLRELEDICDCLGVLYQGGILFEGDIANIKSNVFKVQIAFKEDFSEKNFIGIDIMNIKKHGSVATLIIRGDRDTEKAKLEALNPLILDILPLTLEEIFIYEMEVLGYAYENLSV
ncbi:MAG: ABC transporter ATP-binding protein [Ruminococcaceae bacterium]|nr:ABC transporter ATP-binding protein [Oscillospiraceae bacterium]